MFKLLKFIRNYLKEVKDEDKEQIYDELENGAKPNADYFLMVSLSTIMVVLGLLINNVAVIIGAMLIAPLMTSVITMALGIVRGDLKLFFSAAEAEAKGALLVIIIAVFITIFSPLGDITSEIQVRAIPNLLYLFIALAAGAAGAYAISRPKLNAMLPGVAIATAILPPLATIGIGLGLKRFDVAVGALLLFLTNLIAISLASTVVFWIIGIGPKRRGQKQTELTLNLKRTVALLLIIAIPLTFIMVNTINETNMNKIITQTINDKILGMYQTTLVGFDNEEKNGVEHISATIQTGDNITSNDIDIMKTALNKRLDKNVDLTVEIITLNVYNSAG